MENLFLRCKFHFFICFFYSAVCSGEISNYLLDFDFGNDKNSNKKKHIATVVGITKNVDTQPLQDELSKIGFSSSSFAKLSIPNLHQNALKKYCTQNVSPYLLSQTLSHLSLYQAMLKNRLNYLVVLEQTALLTPKAFSIKEFISRLEKKDKNWDLLFLDYDYRNHSNGERVSPQISVNGKLVPNKRSIGEGLFRVKSRYGTYAYVISLNGAKKILNFSLKNWIDLPFDQLIFKIPNLHSYCTAEDLITIKHNPKIRDPLSQISDECVVDRVTYRLGEELWVDPLSLLTSPRFDIIAKYIYANNVLRNLKLNWHVNLYKSHIRRWNNFYEGAPLKVGFDAFQSSFHSLIDSLKNRGFDLDAEPVPINSNGVIQNGSHRVAVCIALNIPVKVKVVSKAKKNLWKPFSQVMREKHGVESAYLDHMAYEYAKLKKNTYIVCVFPPAFDKLNVAEKVMNKYGDIVYKKNLFLKNNGFLEFIRQIYFGEGWVGNFSNDFRQGRVKTNLCFPEKYRTKPLTIFLYECCGIDTVRKVKEQIRKYIQIGHDSIHINDTHEQTVRLAGTVFNDNSIEFINRKYLKEMPNFEYFFKHLLSFAKQVPIEDICVDASAVLSVYGLRDCRDIDLLHYGKIPLDPQHIIDSHNGYLKYHTRSLDNILFNPNSYFYYNGIKFLKLNLLKGMKLNRHEKKDLRDVELIENL